MNDSIILLLRNIFNKALSTGTDEYLLLSSSISQKLLFFLYERAETIEILPIELIPEQEKIKYWNIAKRFSQDKEEAIKISKAAYMITIVANLKKETE